MENKILEVKNIYTSFKTDGKIIKAVDGVSLHLDKGEIIGLVGESGSGKSVTSMSILQLIMPPGKIDGGDVRVEGTQGNLLSYSMMSEEMRNVRGGKIGMIFQEPMTSLNPILTVGYQIQETIELHLHLGKEESRKKAIEMMRRVGISDPESRFSQYPQHFSGGMRQRIMIAMALAAQPSILIADEATTALDVTTQAQILELLQSLAREKGFSIIIITHNLGLVARYADRIYVMYSGEVVESAYKRELFSRPCHPYTRGLLAAVPRLNDKKDRRLRPIDGNPPNPALRNDYCQFYDRCLYRNDECMAQKWELKEISGGHYSRCCKTVSQLDDKQKRLELNQNSVPVKKISDHEALAVTNLKMYFPVYKGIMKHKVAEVKAVDDVSFTVHKGETLGIVGESGCGKSTLARCIMRAYQPTGGSIIYEGTELVGLNERQLRPLRPKLAMIFQDPFSSLDPRQSAGSIVGEPLKTNKLVVSKKEYNKRVNDLMSIVGLDPALKDRVPREFSGGQRQRLGIARALASNPDLIVCDEPISALDVSIQAQIINLLEDLQAKLGITYLFIAHDLSVVKHISDRIIVMYLGKIVEIAGCEDLYDKPMHPYTQALLSAVPIADPLVEEKRERIHLQGEVPSVMNRPSGCPFCNRCAYSQPECSKAVPELEDKGNGHHVACFYCLDK